MDPGNGALIEHSDQKKPAPKTGSTIGAAAIYKVALGKTNKPRFRIEAFELEAYARPGQYRTGIDLQLRFDEVTSDSDKDGDKAGPKGHGDHVV